MNFWDLLSIDLWSPCKVDILWFLNISVFQYFNFIMKLFRRILLSLFPSEIIHQQMSPVNMFLSFISPKQFFSVVNRRIVENYKLNLFDIGLDPFEVKIWFGDKPTINVKDVDFYYAYNATANLNGRTFYAPANLATMISIVMEVQTQKLFKKQKYTYFKAFIISIFLLTFVFTARIKVFPFTDKEKNYSWFIELFFNFYETALAQVGEKRDEKKLAKIKKALLQEIHLFFMLFYFYRRVNRLFDTEHLSDKEFYQWLFYDDIKKKGKTKTWLMDFINNAHQYNKSTTCTMQDQHIMKLIFPADLLIKYLLPGKDSFVIASKLLTWLFDKEKLASYLHSFLKWDDEFEPFINYIMDWKLFKKNYFKGMKKLSMHKFNLQGAYDYRMEQEIDSFISSLEEGDFVENVKIPKKLVQESAMMDSLVNFYVTYLGWLRIARGDNFYLRLFRKPLIDELVNISQGENMKQDTLYFYGALLYNYSKNTFYYKYAYENIKAGKEIFYLPTKASSKEIQSNMFILKLFYENFVDTLLQDINQKSIKIYITNKKVLQLFQKHFGKKISSLITLKNSHFLHGLYDNVHFFLQNIPEFFTLLEKHIDKKDHKIIKENLYSMDIQLWLACIDRFVEKEIMFHETYEDMTILGILASLRETLFGFLLWYIYLLKEGEEAKIDLQIHALKRIYIIDVLNVSEEYYQVFDEMLDDLWFEYADILKKRISIDDNTKYLSIGLGNRMSFIEGKEIAQILTEVMWEDVIRCRWYLKTITYYNKRYLIPK